MIVTLFASLYMLLTRSLAPVLVSISSSSEFSSSCPSCTACALRLEPLPRETVSLSICAFSACTVCCRRASRVPLMWFCILFWSLTMVSSAKTWALSMASVSAALVSLTCRLSLFAFTSTTMLKAAWTMTPVTRFRMPRLDMPMKMTMKGQIHGAYLASSSTRWPQLLYVTICPSVSIALPRWPQCFWMTSSFCVASSLPMSMTTTMAPP
mmetsp:Transcript_20477/g.64492  ORF Transcript_20477/g.64492 Transcript_20477/m.64492 type:complete len:210 (-) Transcript_20477:1159-1788(-)